MPSFYVLFLNILSKVHNFVQISDFNYVNFQYIKGLKYEVSQIKTRHNIGKISYFHTKTFKYASSRKLSLKFYLSYLQIKYKINNINYYSIIAREHMLFNGLD